MRKEACQVREGSKCEILAAGKSLPLCPQTQTLLDAVGTVPCRLRQTLQLLASKILDIRRSAGAIARGPDLERQVRHELLPGRLIGLPIGGIRKRRDRDELALIMTGKGVVDYVVRAQWRKKRDPRGSRGCIGEVDSHALR